MFNEKESVYVKFVLSEIYKDIENTIPSLREGRIIIPKTEEELVKEMTILDSIFAKIDSSEENYEKEEIDYLETIIKRNHAHHVSIYNSMKKGTVKLDYTESEIAEKIILLAEIFNKVITKKGA